MDLLILGGTNFIGPHLVREAQLRGHSLTLFNRGKTNPGVFDDLQERRGDRKAGDYESLREGKWDVVIDTCAYWPRAVREALDTLGPRVDHYMLISTVSVYAEFDPNGFDETAALATVDEPDSEEVTPVSYGGLKALCEAELNSFAGEATIVRPGLVVGPGDSTDRFTYWPVRIADGGTVLAPGTPNDPLQYIDVRDLARFMIDMVDDTVSGTFNAVTPRGAHTIGELLQACQEACSDPAELQWVNSDFLHQNGVKAWSDLPAWVAPGSPLAGIPHCIATRAVEAGLTHTPLAQTVADTLRWFRSHRDALQAGLSREREQDVLSKWSSAAVRGLSS